MLWILEHLLNIVYSFVPFKTLNSSGNRWPLEPLNPLAQQLVRSEQGTFFWGSKIDGMDLPQSNIFRKPCNAIAQNWGVQVHANCGRWPLAHCHEDDTASYPGGGSSSQTGSPQAFSSAMELAVGFELPKFHIFSNRFILISSSSISTRFGCSFIPKAADHSSLW